MFNINSPLNLLTEDPIKLNVISIKTKLIMLIISNIRENGWNQSQAAKCLNVSQPRISNLMNGQISKFSIDMLFEMLGSIGFLIDFSFNSSPENPISIYMKKPAAKTADLNKE